MNLVNFFYMFVFTVSAYLHVFNTLLLPFILIQCERTSSYQNFFEMIEDAPPYPVAALGMGCAVASEPVAQINFFWNFPLVSSITSDWLLFRCCDSELCRSSFGAWANVVVATYLSEWIKRCDLILDFNRTAGIFTVWAWVRVEQWLTFCLIVT